MTIRVYKPEDVRDMTKPVTLWAVWEGTDGRHHEDAFEYRDRQTIPYTELHGKEEVHLRRIVAEESYPLLSLDRSKEDTSQVLPGTLRFIRIEDLYNVTRICDSAGRVYALSCPAYTYDSGLVVSSETFNGMHIEVHGSCTLLKAMNGVEA